MNPKDNHLLLPGSFIFDLDPKDLKRMREATRRGAGNHHLTDHECDLIIEDFVAMYGYRWVEAELRKNTVVSQFH